MTTDRSRRRVRWTAISATALAGMGTAVAIASDPFPTSPHPPNADVVALETREKALVAEARRVSAMNAERWATYRTGLAARRLEIARVSAAAAGTGGGAGASYSRPASQATYVSSPPVASSGSS